MRLSETEAAPTLILASPGAGMLRVFKAPAVYHLHDAVLRPDNLAAPGSVGSTLLLPISNASIKNPSVVNVTDALDLGKAD